MRRFLISRIRGNIAASVLAKLKTYKKRWNNFCKKILKYELDFTDVVNIIIDFTSPPYQSIIEENEFLKNWSYKDKEYT